MPFISNVVSVIGAESHPALTSVIQKRTRPPGLKIIPTLNRYVGDMSDHCAFREGGVPYLFLSCGYWQHNPQSDCRASVSAQRSNMTSVAMI